MRSFVEVVEKYYTSHLYKLAISRTSATHSRNYLTKVTDPAVHQAEFKKP
jgi:hypothetical protein